MKKQQFLRNKDEIIGSALFVLGVGCGVTGLRMDDPIATTMLDMANTAFCAYGGFRIGRGIRKLEQ